MKQPDFLEGPLTDWAKYLITYSGMQFEAWYKNGDFTCLQYGLIPAHKVDSYIKIGDLKDGSASRVNSNSCVNGSNVSTSVSTLA